jgi:hypothetical protein
VLSRWECGAGAVVPCGCLSVHRVAPVGARLYGCGAEMQPCTCKIVRGCATACAPPCSSVQRLHSSSAVQLALAEWLGSCMHLVLPVGQVYYQLHYVTRVCVCVGFSELLRGLHCGLFWLRDAHTGRECRGAGQLTVRLLGLLVAAGSCTYMNCSRGDCRPEIYEHAAR